MKKIFYIIITFILFATLNYSCSNFDEMNTDPDASTVVSSDMIASQMLVNTFRFWNPNAFDFLSGNLWDKHIASCIANPNPNQYYYSYWPYGNFDGFVNVTSLQNMAESAKGSATESSYQGLYLFLKAWYGFNATLSMGDIPYSEVAKFTSDGIRYPKYDKQQDVVQYILDDLKSASENFAIGKNFTGDIMYNGDVTKWEKLSNALQLKVIQTFGKKATTAQKARFAEIVANGPLMTSNDDNLMITFSENQNSWYPFSDANGEIVRVYTAVSELCVDILKKYNDRRLFIFAEPAAASITSGLTESDWNAYTGAPTQLPAEQLALNNDNGMYSLLNKRFSQNHAGDPMLYFTYSEQCFILAEAAEEGWITGGVNTAQTYYQNGVKAILSYYMNLASAQTGQHGMPITQAYIDGYFTGDAAYNTSGTKAQRIQQLLEQRWLIDFFQGNGEGFYYQYLRTGYPVYPVNPATSMDPEDPNVLPKRWMYPTAELTTNTVNYLKAVKEQFNGYDGINQVPWWLQ